MTTMNRRQQARPTFATPVTTRLTLTDRAYTAPPRRNNSEPIDGVHPR